MSEFKNFWKEIYFTRLFSVEYVIYFYGSWYKTSDMIVKCEESSKDFWRIFYSNERPFFLSYFNYNKYYSPVLLQVSFVQ